MIERELKKKFELASKLAEFSALLDEFKRKFLEERTNKTWNRFSIPDMVLGVDELLVTAVVGEEPNLHCARSAMKIVPEIFFLGAVKSTTCVFEDLGWSGLFPDYSYQAVKE